MEMGGESDDEGDPSAKRARLDSKDEAASTALTGSGVKQEAHSDGDVEMGDAEMEKQS